MEKELKKMFLLYALIMLVIVTMAVLSRIYVDEIDNIYEQRKIEQWK